MPEKPKNKLQQFIQEFRDNKGVLLQLMHYVKPYRVRYFLGILCGTGFNFINGAIMLLIYFVGTFVFANTGDANLAAMIHLGPLTRPVRYFAAHYLHLDHVSRFEGLV